MAILGTKQPLQPVRRKAKAQYSKYYDPQKRRKQYLENHDKERAYNKKQHQAVKARILEILGEKQCARCGFNDVRVLQLDHINGGGTKEAKFIFKSNSQMLRHYLKHPETVKEHLQILCANCNWIKRFENGEVRGLETYAGNGVIENNVENQPVLKLTDFIE